MYALVSKNYVFSWLTSLHSGNGICNFYDSCTCSPGYGGKWCDEFTCFGLARNASGVCSGHGHCTDINTCKCNCGWMGVDCSLIQYANITITETVIVYKNATGNNCTVQEEEIKHLNESLIECLNRTCPPPPPPVYINQTVFVCEGISNCYGYDSRDPRVCNGNGVCKDGMCSCWNGTEGRMCEKVPRGGGRCAGNVTLCHSLSGGPSPFIECHFAGFPNSAECRCAVFVSGQTSPFYGHNCEAYKCGNSLSTSPHVCSGHGACIGPNNCSCLPGFTGSNCDKSWDCSATNNCSGKCYFVNLVNLISFRSRPLSR